MATNLEHLQSIAQTAVELQGQLNDEELGADSGVTNTELKEIDNVLCNVQANLDDPL